MTIMLNMLSSLVDWDRSVFVKLNSEWTNTFFDAVLPWIRNASVWAPLYLFIIAMVMVNFGKQSLWWILLFLATLAITDMTGTYALKHTVQRLRPCWDNELPSIRLLLGQCSGGYSFTSNHAANHFGMAVFFFMTFRRIIPRLAWIGLPWAALVGYSQIYVGVHYPLDVVGGSILGIFSGLLTSYIFNKRFGFAIFANQSTGAI